MTCFKSKTYRDNEGGKAEGGSGQWVAAAEVDDCGHVVPLGGKAQHNRAEQSRAVNAAAAAAQCSLGVPVQVYPVASAWQLATGNGQQHLWGPDWAEL